MYAFMLLSCLPLPFVGMSDVHDVPGCARRVVPKGSQAVTQSRSICLTGPDGVNEHDLDGNFERAVAGYANAPVRASDRISPARSAAGRYAAGAISPILRRLLRAAVRSRLHASVWPIRYCLR